MIDIPGYVCYRKDRSSGRGGGVLFYVRDTFKCNEIKLDTSLALNVVLSPKINFNIAVLYNPPSHDISFHNDLDELLKLSNFRSESILLGDFNINWLVKSYKQKLQMILSKHDFQQMVKGPTRITRMSKTMIDLMVTNRAERVTKTYNLLTGLSDHNMTLIVRKLTKQRLPIFINEHKSGNAVIPKNKLPQLENELNHIDWNDVLQTNDLDDCCNTLIKTLTELIEKYIKIFKCKRRRVTLPWLNNDIRQLIKKKEILH